MFLLKLKQKRISKTMVIEVLKSPDYKISSHLNRIIASKNLTNLKGYIKRENGDIIFPTPL